MSKHIQKLDNLEEYQLLPSIADKIKQIEPRIQSGKYLTLIASFAGQLIDGVAISWTNSMHPHALYSKVVSADSGEDLMDYLIKSNKSYTKVITSCFSDEAAEVSKVKKMGFVEFRKTYEVEIEIEILLEKLAYSDNCNNHATLQEALKNEQVGESLFQLLKVNYEQTHLDNPVAQLPWQEWKKILLEDTPDLKTSKILLNDGLVRGYSFVHPIIEEHYEIGWMAYGEQNELQEALRTQLGELKNRGIRTVGFEIDTTDHFAYSLKEILGLEKERSWNSYKYEREFIEV